MPAVSPQLDSEGAVRVVVKSGGKKIPDTHGLVSVHVRHAVGSIPSARIVLLDGDMPEGKWPVADADEFKPGAEISIAAGYGEAKENLLFEGIVVKLGMRITGDNKSTVVVDCRDKAARMTIGRKNALFKDFTDSAAVKQIVGSHGLHCGVVDDTRVTLPELVQYYCSDWDFVMARAEANGLIVTVEAGKVSLRKPQTSASADLKVSWGTDLIEFNADLDARSQLQSVQAAAWDSKQQAEQLGTAQSPKELNAQGNLKSSTLSDVLNLASFRLQTPAPWPRESLTAWGEAQQVKAGLARIRGRLKFQGSALAKAGGLIDVKGVGARYEGNVFVGAVEQDISQGNWLTTAEFGLAPDWFCAKADVVAPAAAGLLPGVEGLQVGVVVELEKDPGAEHRIQVKLPVLGADVKPIWARLMQFHASAEFGAFFLPEIGDEVVLAFFNNDPSGPVVLGSLYSSKRKPPYELKHDNDKKAIVTRCKNTLEFDDKDKIITLTTPAKNKVVISDKDKSILLSDQNGNTVELNDRGVKIDTPKDLSISAKGKVTIDAVGAISISSKADLKCTGLNVSCEAQVGLTAKGSASAELSASGQTTVKGAMVMIN
jgi:Rhs element Vgr protein